MKKLVVSTACLILGLMNLQDGVLLAADEDTQASVYLVFDPETGEFVTVDDPSVTAQHEAALDQEAIESVADTSITGGETVAANLPLTWIVGAAIVALLGAAGFAWSRRGQTSTT